MKLIIRLIAIVILLTSFIEKKEISLWYPHSVTTLMNCDEREMSMEFVIKTDSRKKIEVHSFEFGDNDFVFMINGKKMNPSEKIFINKRKSLVCKLIYKRTLNKKQEEFTFKTNQKEYMKNCIKIVYGAYDITHNPIREGKEQVVNFTQSCNDSIRVYFPYGGTISGASLYKDSISIGSPYKNVSYGIGDENNYLKFSRNDIGRYYVRYGACHWGNNFWLTIK